MANLRGKTRHRRRAKLAAALCAAVNFGRRGCRVFPRNFDVIFNQIVQRFVHASILLFASRPPVHPGGRRGKNCHPHVQVATASPSHAERAKRAAAYKDDFVALCAWGRQWLLRRLLGTETRENHKNNNTHFLVTFFFRLQTNFTFSFPSRLVFRHASPRQGRFRGF